MNQEFRPHPVLVNYEASRDGVIRNRNLKKPVGFVSNQGYLRFTAGNKIYHIHRIVYEALYGSIKDGIVIDHINGVKTDNSIENQQAILQSENIKHGRISTHAKLPKIVKSFNTETSEENN